MSKEKSKQTLSDRYSEMTGNNSNNPLQNLGSRHKPLIIGGIAVVVAAGIAIATVSLSGHSDKKSDNDSSAYNLVVTPEGNDASSDETVSKAAAGTYDVCMKKLTLHILLAKFVILMFLYHLLVHQLIHSM